MLGHGRAVLIRPDGASVNIAPPAVAFDGTTGLAGDVDTHFLSRFHLTFQGI